MNDALQLSYFNHTSPNWHVKGSETFARLRRRISSAILHVAAANPGRTVGITCHGSAIRNALAAFHEMSVEESAHLGHSDNTAVSLLEVENGKVRVVFENDNSHLPEEISTLAQQKWWRHQDGSIVDTNMWFCPLDLQRDAGLYYEARKEAWVDIHGSLQYFDGNAFLSDAMAHWTYDCRSVMRAMLGDTYAGILQLDLRRDADKGVGYIPFFYMTPEFRKRGLGVQMLGQAVSTYRPMGRNRLQVRPTIWWPSASISVTGSGRWAKPRGRGSLWT
jgi:probable phosphoglycerate mutase